VGEDRRDSETAEVDQWWSVVAGIGQWWSQVDAGVFGWPYLTLTLTALYLGNQNAPKKAIST
jgi:hypothetical protein